MPVTALRRRAGVALLDPAEARARSVRRRVGVAWALLFFNTLTYIPGPLVHIPSIVGKGLAQSALPLALLVALTVNPKVRLRPNVFLSLISVVVLETVLTSTSTGHLSTVLRTFRLTEFVAALWLLTPWWGRRDMLLLQCHLRCLFVALGSVLLGSLIAPGRALAYGRLSGVIWPMGPTQVAQYAAVAAGVIVVLWLARLLSGRVTLMGLIPAVIILLLAHTRTALVGLAAGLLVAGLSLFTVNARVRKFFAAGAAAVSIGVITVAGVVTTWLARGESAQGLASLSGRTNFWALVVHVPRTRFQDIFGFGLSNGSVNGLPIDSNWLSSYMQEGLLGVLVGATILVFLLVTAFFQPPGVRRALALFLVTYCMLASFTEDTFSDVTTYLLSLTVAASLLVGPLARRADYRAVPAPPQEAVG
jgi:hypothetical protein